MLKFRPLLKFALPVLVLCGPQPAAAATFCVAGAGLPPQCLYEDIDTCQRATESPNTSCILNPNAVVSFTGGERYCVIGSNRAAQCLYADRSQCNGQAAAGRSICIDRKNGNDPNNPFRYDNRVQY